MPAELTLEASEALDQVYEAVAHALSKGATPLQIKREVEDATESWYGNALT